MQKRKQIYLLMNMDEFIKNATFKKLFPDNSIPTFDQFVDCDNNVIIAEQLTEDDILESVLKQKEDKKIMKLI